MKLIYCLSCDSSVRLVGEESRQCECGDVHGIYKDDLNAIFVAHSENYVLLGYANSTFVKAVKDYKKNGSPDGWGLNFSAFVIPEPCSTFVRVSEKEYKKFCETCLH